MYIAYFGPFPVCDKDLLSSDFAIFHSQLNRFFVQYLVNKRERAQKNRLSLSLSNSLSPSLPYSLFPSPLSLASTHPPGRSNARAPHSPSLFLTEEATGRAREPGENATERDGCFVLERFMQLISRWLNGQFSFVWRKSPHHLRLRWMHL